MMMKLTAVISCVLLSTSSASVANVNCNKVPEFSGQQWGLKRSTGGDRGAQQRAKVENGGNCRKKTTEFAGWWRGLKRHPTSTTKMTPGDSGRPTLSGENQGVD